MVILKVGVAVMAVAGFQAGASAGHKQKSATPPHVFLAATNPATVVGNYEFSKTC